MRVLATRRFFVVIDVIVRISIIIRRGLLTCVAPRVTDVQATTMAMAGDLRESEKCQYDADV